MKHALIMGGIALLVTGCTLITSCSLFRQKAVHRSQRATETRTDEKVQTVTNLESQQLTISATTLESGHRYQVEIVPDGSFHYSPEEGFTGSAQRITVQGQVETSSFRSQTAEGRSFLLENTVSEAHREQRTESRLTDKQVKVERKGIGGWWIWLVGIVILFVAWKAGRVLIRRFF